MTNQSAHGPSIEDDFLDAAGHLQNIANILADSTQYGDDHAVYAWNNSKAGENLTVSIPTHRGPSTLAIDAISQPFRRALREHRVTDPTEDNVTITLNTPESGKPAVDLRAGQVYLGILAASQFNEFAKIAGILHPATFRQRVGRAMLRWFESRLASVEKLTVRDGQSFVGPYDF